VAELPPDPDLGDLPDELVLARGLLRIRGRDPRTGEMFEAPAAREHIAARDVMSPCVP
jgi:hypothetical protein